MNNASKMIIVSLTLFLTLQQLSLDEFRRAVHQIDINRRFKDRDILRMFR